MNNYFIILASGQSKRFNSSKPKQFNIYKNKALFKHSLEKAIKSKLFKKIILVVNNKKNISTLTLQDNCFYNANDLYPYIKFDALPKSTFMNSLG